MFSSSISRNDKLGVKLKHKSWSLNNKDFKFLQNPKIGFSALLPEEPKKKKVPKIIKIFTKNYYKVKGFTHCKSPLSPGKPEFMKSNYLINSMKKFVAVSKLRTQFFTSTLKYGPTSLHRQNNRRKEMMRQKGDGIL